MQMAFAMDYMMKQLQGCAVICLFSAISLVSTARSQELPFLHPLFTDHMVIQREISVPVWGWTNPGEEISVTLAGQSATATAGKDGHWQVKLAPLQAGGPHELAVTGSRVVTISDILAGDVWLCSGQSNMEWPVAASNNSEQEIAAADHSRLRLFTVPKRVSTEAHRTINSQWQLCTPQTIRGFSAVGYFFGRDLQRELDVPIGLIHTSWGGTLAEAWTSDEALSTMDDFLPAIAAFREMSAAQRHSINGFESAMEKWWNANDPGSNQSWSAASVATDNWKTMALPGNWESRGLDEFDGIVWFRKEFEVTDADVGKAAVLHLGPIDDRDTTWVNGKQVGAMNDWAANRNYSLPVGTLKAGRNVVAIRVLDTAGGGGLHGQSNQMSLDITDSDSIPLAGDWKYSVSTPLNKTTPAPQQLVSNPNIVTVLYNGMLAPLAPYAITRCTTQVSRKKFFSTPGQMRSRRWTGRSIAVSRSTEFAFRDGFPCGR